ncbi:hypothetical protein ACS0TY_034745 [Phlomoides rotata]
MVMEIIVSVMLLVVGIVVLIVIHVCVVGRAFRDDSINVTGSIPSRVDSIPSMNPEDIKKLPCFDYRVDEKVSVECAICLESFNGGEKCRILENCNHIFHAECIDSWLLKTAACPVCRTDAQSPQFEDNTSSCSGEGGIEML